MTWIDWLRSRSSRHFESWFVVYSTKTVGFVEVPLRAGFMRSFPFGLVLSNIIMMVQVKCNMKVRKKRKKNLVDCGCIENFGWL